ncbi:MAG TPA: hypothetical protein VKA80_08395 [Beijerinckiaceae bacterium]|nr:hypothetical protein [Beijerinckiaceae bacterium]
MNRKITTLAFALTAAVGALAFSVESADARGGHGGFGRGGHGGGMMRHGGFGRHGGFHHRRHFGHRHWRHRGYGWGYGGYYTGCFYNPWGRLICRY